MAKDSKQFLKDPKIYLSLLVVLVVSVLLFPEEGKFKYSYQSGADRFSYT